MGPYVSSLRSLVLILDWSVRCFPFGLVNLSFVVQTSNWKEKIALVLKACLFFISLVIIKNDCVFYFPFSLSASVARVNSFAHSTV